MRTASHFCGHACRLRLTSSHIGALQKRINWQEELVRALWRAQVADSADAALNELHVMLMQINDPYTRIAPRRYAPGQCRQLQKHPPY